MGVRYSIVAFVHGGYKDLSISDQDKIRALGFVLPGDSLQRGVNSTGSCVSDPSAVTIEGGQPSNAGPTSSSVARIRGKQVNGESLGDVVVAAPATVQGGSSHGATSSKLEVQIEATPEPCYTSVFVDAVDSESRLLTRFSAGAQSCSCTSFAAAAPRMPVIANSCRSISSGRGVKSPEVEPVFDFEASLTNLCFDHRPKTGGSIPFFACVARPVGRKEIDNTPAAQDAMRKEWSQ